MGDSSDMTDAEKTETSQDTLTTYQAQACQAVRVWSVYIAFYAVAVMLIVVTFRSDQNGIQNLLIELVNDPAVWGIVLMPPLFIMFLRWSALELVTQLLGAELDSNSIPNSMQGSTGHRSNRPYLQMLIC